MAAVYSVQFLLQALAIGHTGTVTAAPGEVLIVRQITAVNGAGASAIGILTIHDPTAGDVAVVTLTTGASPLGASWEGRLVIEPGQGFFVSNLGPATNLLVSVHGYRLAT